MFKDSQFVDFNDCEEFDGDSQVSFTPDQVKEASKIVELPSGGKQFGQGIDSLTVFVEDSVGGEITSINRIELYGHPMEQADMSQLKATKSWRKR